jgi:excisionase family DNA binding protein
MNERDVLPGTRLYRVADVCSETHFGRTFVYEALAAGHLSSIGAGKRRRVTHEALMAWIASMGDEG